MKSGKKTTNRINPPPLENQVEVGLDLAIQRFITSILFSLVLPLLPIAIELSEIGAVREKTLVLTGSFYAISFGLVSGELVLFSIFLIAGLAQILMLSFPNNLEIQIEDGHISFYVILGTFLTHTFDRFIRHVIHKEPIIRFKT